MDALGKLQQFRAERSENNVLHLVFDMPGRPMNVFSNAAIAELGVFSRWLRESDVKGVVIRSGKPSAFCAGADLAELGLAYDMIMAAPAETRDRVAFDHFFRLSQALRGIETAGKPVAAAIAGLALGGGGELALATHHRVMVDDPRVAFGLPESLVGLLPGGGGTQRLPRLTGIEKAFPILLEGARLSGQAAIAAGVVDQLVPAGEEVAAAERWVLSHPSASQPWDRPGWRPADVDDVAAIVARKRESVLAETLGHYPAPLAILDHCSVHLLAGGGACHQWQTRATRAAGAGIRSGGQMASHVLRGPASGGGLSAGHEAWLSRLHGRCLLLRRTWRLSGAGFEKIRDSGATNRENSSVKTPDRRPRPRPVESFGGSVMRPISR
jgi:enoyl-CoA hydratase/carnithine racemase